MVNAGFGIIRNPLLEKVCLALQRDHIHEVEGVRLVIILLVTQCNKEAISDKLDVLAHQVSIHANEFAWEGICKELLFDGDSFRDDTFDGLRVGTAFQVAKEETGKVGVHTLVTRDEFVRKGETRHKATLLEPENRRKRSREEDTLDSSECHQAFAEACIFIRNPAESPISLTLNARDCLDGVKKVVTLGGVFDVSVDEEGVGFRVDILHHNLEAVEATRLSSLYFVGEAFD